MGRRAELVHNPALQDSEGELAETIHVWLRRFSADIPGARQAAGAALQRFGEVDDRLANQVVVLGKRISDRLTLGYEQGLSFASGALRLEYALTRTVTLRAEAGTVSAICLYFRRSFE